MRILIISPVAEIREQISRALFGNETEVLSANDAQQGLKLLKEIDIDTALLHTALRDLQVGKLIRKIQEKSPLADIIVALESGGGLSSDEILSYGTDEIVEIPLNPEELSFKVKNLWQAKQNLKACNLSGKSAELKSIAEQVLQIAPTDITILITGESGVGKELVARAIHHNSPRKSKPFFAVNCAAFAEGILESELFGHERGAFTGAITRKQGVFEAATGGTIFLDEVGELKPATQVKLLRVLEEKEIMRVGGTERIEVDARVVAATNRDLTLAVQERSFRRDLYYRLAVIKIEVPPLRERVKDISILAHEFLKQLQEKYPDRQPAISESALELIIRYHWPGNVRELKNFIESGVALSRTGRIEVGTVSDYIEKQSQGNRNLPVVTGRSTTEAEHDLIFQALSSLKAEIISLKNLIKEGLEMTVGYPAKSEQASETGVEVAQESLEDLEKEHIRKVLIQVGRNRRKAAKILGIGERTLYRKLKEYSLR